MMRAPEPPSGWPSAIAPPFGLSCFSSAPMSFNHASGTGANASLTSKTPMSASLRPERFNAFSVAGIGAVSIITGIGAGDVAVCTLAIGLRPYDFAYSADTSSSAAAPSEICDELPAWMTPSSLNAGLS